MLGLCLVAHKQTPNYTKCVLGFIVKIHWNDMEIHWNSLVCRNRKFDTSKLHTQRLQQLSQHKVVSTAQDFNHKRSGLSW